MPFIQPEPFTFFNIKLTDHGRRSASAGKPLFSKLILSDREVDYSVGRDGKYNILNNRVLDINDFYQDMPEYSFGYNENFGDLDGFLDTTGVIDPSQSFESESFNVSSEKILATGSTSSTTISNFIKGTRNLSYNSNGANWGTNKITFAAGAYTPVQNDIVFIPWVSPDYAGVYPINPLPNNEPAVLSVYKIVSAVTPTNFILDRPIPNFSSGPTVVCQFFRDNLIESYYGTGTTSDPGIWNMNIVRTHTVMGTELSVVNKVSGFTTYGSIEFNGIKHFFGFGDDLPVFGVIHYTNKWTGNTYAEQFVEKTFELNLPGIMWHHNYDALLNNVSGNTFTSYNSSGTTWGLYLSDNIGPTIYDPIAKTNYRELKDGRNEKSISVGRVYHKLKIIVITDQELLTALTYKSNRNYTLPDFEVSLSPTPQVGLYPAHAFSGTSVSGYTATGFQEGYDYFITYIAENSDYAAGTSIGNAPSLPCGYIKKIAGGTDGLGNEQFIKIRFPNPDSFPYMRDDIELSSANLATGWNANTVQILMNVYPTSVNYQVGNVPHNTWRRVSNATLGGNGIYRASDYGLQTIDPKIFNSYEFIISQEDYNSGATYNINTGLTSNQSFLNFGDECFVYGTIKTGIASAVYKTLINVYIPEQEMNGSDNQTFDPEINAKTYITEIAILDDDNFVTAVGKPTYPIMKNNTRWLNLRLDIDF